MLRLDILFQPSQHWFSHPGQLDPRYHSNPRLQVHAEGSILGLEVSMPVEVAAYALKTMLVVMVIHSACKARVDRLLLAVPPLLMIAGVEQGLAQYGGWSVLLDLTEDQAVDVFVSGLMYGGLFMCLALLICSRTDRVDTERPSR
ncbi:hypothetical protein [Pseudomonas sp. S1(2024)]|uniref:hypothetical protein n=1 Tax=Pseudomonas sp. S1(2024) TaxID=3390191 RepID=UPI0039783D88